MAYAGVDLLTRRPRYHRKTVKTYDDAKKAREMAMVRYAPQQAATTRLAQANGEVCTTPNDPVKKK